MIEIEQVNLRLPAGYEARAAHIAREFAAALFPLAAHAPLRLERAACPPVRIAAGAGDRDIGEALARAVLGGVAGLRS